MGKSVYEMVTERIISQLEQGVIPWEKPWTGIRSGAYNRISKKSYSLLNQMLLKHDGVTKAVKQIPLLRYYNVFHITQVDGVEPLPKDALNDIEPIEKAENILHDYWTKENITVEHTASNKASKSLNCI